MLTPLEQHASARQAVAVSHLALAIFLAQPVTGIGGMMLREMVLAQQDNAHAMLRRARRRLVLSAVALIIEALVVGIIVYLALLGTVYSLEPIVNR